MSTELLAKIRLMAGRAILSLINDAGAIQTAQARLLAGETQDDVERIQEYGFTSAPHEGAEAVIIFIGGNRDHGTILAADDRRHRPRGLAPGESTLYDDQGQRIHISRAGIRIEGAGLPITIHDTPTVNIMADSAVNITAPTATITAETAVNIISPQTTFSGQVAILGGLQLAGLAQGAGGGPFKLSGGLANTGGKIESNGVVLETHVHPGVQPGNGKTGTPG